MDSSAADILVDSPSARPARRGRLVRPVLLLLAGSALVAGAARGWDAVRHDHDAGHGVPATPAALEQAMIGPFAAADGRAVAVLDATCAGQGDATAAAYTHFSCRLVFDDGTSDEVVVHLLEGDEIFFKSSVGATR